MKKTILLIASLMFVFASASFAADITSTGTSIGSQSYKPSNNVTIRVTSTSTRYAVKSGHKKGNRIYATNSDETKMYYQDVTGTITDSNNPVDNLGTVAATDTYDTGWNSL